jgi:acyl carrier protein
MPAVKLEFVRRFAEALNEDESSITEETRLADLQGWDSVGQLSAIALIDESFNRRVSVDALRKCETVGDLLKLATT